MAQFNDWCLSVDEPVGNHFRQVMTGQAANLMYSRWALVSPTNV